MINLGLLAAFGSVVCWVASQMLAKTVAPRLGIFRTAILVVSFGIAAPLLVYLYAPVGVSAYMALLAFVSGILAGIGYLFYYKSVESQQITNIAAIGLVQAAILVVFGVLFLGEPLDAIQIAAAALIVIGVLLVSLTRKMKVNRMLIPAMIANIFWAGYWILLTEAITTSGQVNLPILISRTTGAVLVVIVSAFVLTRNRQRFTNIGLTLRIVLALAILEGMVDGLGNLVFGYAIDFNLLAIASLLAVLIPVFIAGLAHFVYRERLTRVQLAGVAFSIIGAALIALF